MARKFRQWTPDQNHLFPRSPRDWLPQNHLVYFLLDVCEQIDISPIVDDYDTNKAVSLHPRMMLVLLLYAYSVGVFSSRKIMGRCEMDVAFRVIVGDDIPDFRRIAEFRKRHLQHMQLLFVEILSLCRESGLLKVGRLALDGTKIKANASRHKAMSYDRMTSEEERLQKEIDELLKQVQASDEADDAQHGIDLRGDELPAGGGYLKKSTREVLPRSPRHPAPAPPGNNRQERSGSPTPQSRWEALLLKSCNESGSRPGRQSLGRSPAARNTAADWLRGGLQVSSHVPSLKSHIVQPRPGR